MSEMNQPNFRFEENGILTMELNQDIYNMKCENQAVAEIAKVQFVKLYEGPHFIGADFADYKDTLKNCCYDTELFALDQIETKAVAWTAEKAEGKKSVLIWVDGNQFSMGDFAQILEAPTDENCMVCGVCNGEPGEKEGHIRVSIWGSES